MNAADEPDRRHVARVHAGLAAHLPHTLAIAEVDIWKRRRFGNLVLVGSRSPCPWDHHPEVAQAPFPSRVLSGRQLTEPWGPAAPFTDHDARPSPAPPTPAGQWRLR